MATLPDGADYDENRGWREFNINEIYTAGHPGFVPNPDDRIHDKNRGLFIVTEITDDYETVMVPWEIPGVGGVNGDDIMRGAGPGHVSESFRILIDENVFPNTMTFDARLKMPGPSVKEVIVYRGSDIRNEDNIVSRMYDQNGVLLGNAIPMIPVNDAAGNPTGFKVPAVGATTAELETGELVTAVLYGDAGQEVGIYTLLIERTGYIRHSNAPMKYVMGIELVSPYLDKQTNQLKVPINLPMSNVAMFTRITYSDGRQVDHTIDGVKVRVDGLDNNVSTVPERVFPVVLKYTLSNKEVNYTGLPGSDVHVARSYEVKSIAVDGTHKVSLFTYPTWNPTTQEYDLKHYLANLDRTYCKDVTPHVSITQQSNPFNPSRFGVHQDLAFVLNLRDASPMFKEYQHVQNVGINLIGPGTDSGTLWTVEHTPDQNPPYGWDVVANLRFLNASAWELDLSCGMASREVWLANVYRRTLPLFDSNTEAHAPDPTHFEVIFKGSTIKYNISQWDELLTVPNDYEIGETLFVRFIHQTTGQDLHLSVSGFTVKHTT